MPETRLMRWLEALPIVIAGAAAVLFGPSLALSTALGFVGVALAVYALVHGARAWAVALGLAVNVPLAVIAVYIIVAAAAD
jgi:uncharacterized membrane-anchored protein YitT (DUF2179 family)